MYSYIGLTLSIVYCFVISSRPIGIGKYANIGLPEYSYY